MTECKLCDNEYIGFFAFKGQDHIPLCKEHAELLVFNKSKSLKQRVIDAWNAPSGMKPTEYHVMEGWSAKFGIFSIIIAIIALAGCMIYSVMIGYSVKAMGGHLGWISIMVGIMFIIGVICGKKEFWNEWIMSGEWGGERMYKLQWILGIVLIVLPFILWILDVIWLL